MLVLWDVAVVAASRPTGETAYEIGPFFKFVEGIAEGEVQLPALSGLRCAVGFHEVDNQSRTTGGFIMT